MRLPKSVWTALSQEVIFECWNALTGVQNWKVFHWPSIWVWQTSEASKTDPFHKNWFINIGQEVKTLYALHSIPDNCQWGEMLQVLCSCFVVDSLYLGLWSLHGCEKQERKLGMLFWTIIINLWSDGLASVCCLSSNFQTISVWLLGCWTASAYSLYIHSSWARPCHQLVDHWPGSVGTCCDCLNFSWLSVNLDAVCPVFGDCP